MDSEVSVAAKAVLSEIKEALIRFQEKGENWTIFIDKMGLSQDERQTLRDCLGKGGLRIHLEDTGEPAEWQECAIAGVWYGVFYNGSNQPILETIEVGAAPQVVMAQPEDVTCGIELLQQKILSI